MGFSVWYDVLMDKLTTFQNQTVTYVETQQVKEGVEADLYTFNDDASKDLAIVRVAAGHKTPLQRVLKGEKTVEGYLGGTATLTVTHPDESQSISAYPGSTETEAVVAINDTMQWSANTYLTFYEICWPPYEDGRFENLN
jgi:hypothetical protein